MRIICISDTHDMFRELEVPDGDLLLHAGDLSRTGSVSEVTASLDWLRSLPHPHKVVIAGNHDRCLAKEGARQMMSGLTYLVDETCTVGGVRIFGSPWSPAQGQWAFQAERGEDLFRCWERIPLDTQILVTHGPPFGILDTHRNGTDLGCKDLLAKVYEVRPALHLFGHVHESYGFCRKEDIETLFVNASSSSLGYKRTNRPIALDWLDGRLTMPEQPQETAARGGALDSYQAWEQMVAQYGAPREVRYLCADEQQSELSGGHVFWLEATSDGFGGGDVEFSLAAPGDNLSDRGADHLRRRWAFTFGVPITSDWLASLSHSNTWWEKYSDIPHLPI